jgi:hypothetical protein
LHKNYKRGFPKTSAFGKATLDLWEKAGFRPLFQDYCRKPTGFWEMLKHIEISVDRDTYLCNFIIMNRQRILRDGVSLSRRPAFFLAGYYVSRLRTTRLK